MRPARPPASQKRALLRFSGSLETGFQVILEIRLGLDRILIEKTGTLPACPALIRETSRWRSSYEQCLRQGRISGLKIGIQASLPHRIQDCNRLGKDLSATFCDWLHGPGLTDIRASLRGLLDPQDEAQLLVRSTDIRLHRLPWHNWPLLEFYPRLEVVFGSPPKWIERPTSPSQKVRILAVLGDRENIDVEKDRDILSALPNAEVEFLVEPDRALLDRSLWEKSWDILFFAGHSHSIGQQGQISLNKTEVLTIGELSNALTQAISRGLQLAIFNSCDGLGIAYELEDLHLPQMIVMREPVPDRIAHEFLKPFLADFAAGLPLSLALRQARERLQGLESQFPTATWLPVLFQNSAMLAPTWQSLQQHPEPPRPLWLRLLLPLGIGTAAAAVAIALRLLGLLQPAELALFDHWLRSRPAELPDGRIVVVEASAADLDRELPGDLQSGQSLSDKTQEQLLEKLLAYEPAFIGWDIYRNFKTERPRLEQRLAETDNLITICKFADPDPKATAFKGYVQAPEIPESDLPTRVGFSDGPEDPDRKHRIQLLYSDPDSTCPARYSLSSILGFSYLQKTEGIELAETSAKDGYTWRWGNVAIAPIGGTGTGKFNQFQPYGPYARADVRGHQIWLNYRSSHPSGDSKRKASPIETFKRFTVADVLEGKLTKTEIENKIVLVGITGTGLTFTGADMATTPFRDQNGAALAIPGVYIQAQMTSQIISAALDGRKLLRALPWALDLLLVWIAVLPLLAFLYSRSPKWFSIAIAIEILLLYGIAWATFTALGLYLPWIPASLALILGGVASERLNFAKERPAK